MSTRAGWTQGPYSWKCNAGFLSMSVAWDAMAPRGANVGFRYTVGSVRSVKHYATADEAMAAAERAARRLLTEALAALDATQEESAPRADTPNPNEEPQ